MSTKRLNERMRQLGHSEIRAMTQACEEAKGLNMAQGVCDTPAPAVVLKAAAQAMDQGKNLYSRFDGLPELRQALAIKLSRDNDIQADPETEITVSAGATGSFHAACLGLLNPGDEVILFEPYYQYHISALMAVEAIPVIVSMQAPDWTFSPEAVEQVVTQRTRAIIVNSPGNPSGKVFSREELDAVAQISMRHDLFVFTDEIYEYFLYDGRRHVSMASLPGMAERTITIGGYSKTFSITGWRIGYSVAAQQWAEVIGAMNDLLYVCAPTP
ncbi:MAG TPA: pyridoxal phosphate-dependent aminotransferase, partial [Nitrospira sp.]|nr:pyridoxal phosphate-dependent aminotransferase [Nitrospira sp.]